MNGQDAKRSLPTLTHFPLPAKVLVTAVIMTTADAMLGALGQVVVHDVIPTFVEMQPEDESGESPEAPAKTVTTPETTSHSRGDLFSEAAPAQEPSGI